MKTYTECEQEIEAVWQRAKSRLPDVKEFNVAREAGFMRALAVEKMYENELLRDQAEIRDMAADTREMHALLERLGGK